MRGHPENPLDRPAYLEKFRIGGRTAASPYDEHRMDSLIAQVENLVDLEDTRLLTRQLGP